MKQISKEMAEYFFRNKEKEVFVIDYLSGTEFLCKEFSDIQNNSVFAIEEK
jgi:hypothetical protein